MESSALNNKCAECGNKITGTFSFMIGENWYCYDCYHKLFDNSEGGRSKVERKQKTTKTRLSKEAKSLVKMDQLICNAYYNEMMSPKKIASLFDIPVGSVYRAIETHKKKYKGDIKK